MSEEQQVYGGGKFCGNCGMRVDGDCTLSRAEMEQCMLSPGRVHWRKLATDRERLEELIRAGRDELEQDVLTGPGKPPCETCRHYEMAGDDEPCCDCSPFYDQYASTIKKNDHEPPLTGISNTQWRIREECHQVMDILLTKNRKYGDSAISPVRVFSKADPAEQINVRLDDKISRLMSGQTDDDEDVELDLIGYLILKRVQRRVAE